MQTLVAATSGVPEYQLTAVGAGSLVLTRRYNPTWAIVVAVLGAFFLLIGLLALLYKETEVLTVTLTPVDGGTAVTVSGRASAEMFGRLNAVLAGSQPLGTPAPDVTRCPQCAEAVKPEARICPYCGHDLEAGNREASAG
jgi:hypothetical protein